MKWIIGSSYESYRNSLRLLNILPIPMSTQMNDILLYSILQSTKNHYLKLPPKFPLTTWNSEMIKVTTSRKFIFKTCGLTNKTRNSFDIPFKAWLTSFKACVTSFKAWVTSFKAWVNSFKACVTSFKAWVSSF